MIYVIPYLLTSFLNILFVYKHHRLGKTITKPLLMPLLILFYISNVNQVNLLIIIALFCGFLGDVFLLNASKQPLVLGGITSFLLGHIFYIIIFLTAFPSWFLTLIIPYLILEFYLLKKLLPYMEHLKIPGTIYMTVILLMSYSSLTRIWDVPFLNFFLTFIGSILFIVSDTILAIDIFKGKTENNDNIVMVTYILAQFFIVLGFIV